VFVFLFAGHFAQAQGPLSSFYNPSTQQQQVFYIGADQNVYEVYWEPGSAPWAGWDMTSLAGAPKAAVGSPLSSFYNPSTQQQQVFYIGADQNV
jgi:hypothetical protein